jgi:hypothetical protein
MSLKAAHDLLGWPEPQVILHPSGSGPSFLARLAKQKLQRAIRRIPNCARARVGILATNPEAKSTEAPLAIVVEFRRPVQDEVLRETHRLAWNFARSPLLITIDPSAVRCWSCCEPPAMDEGLFDTAEITDARLSLDSQPQEQTSVIHALSWISLASGAFFRGPDRASLFNRDGAADRLLLENLKEVRRQLHAGDSSTGRPPLDYDTIHDLLARIMFMQFLADRKDSDGNPALNQSFLEQRYRDGTLASIHATFAEVLQHKRDTYRLFRWLNRKFNGDLFPGKAERKEEARRVFASHLRFLADFITGDIELRAGQRFLWRQYSFDVIPLEFISSIYEEFIRNSDGGISSGVVYTPSHLVDFILDGVLDWCAPDWELRILDPACGSGIFLVKAFQRLVHRWRLAHPHKRPSAKTLRRMLETQLFGVDTEPEAVRVASFSLYLAMCDEIDPKRYWTSIKFPKLRDRTLQCHDFFEDGPTLRASINDEGLKFDVVVGNAPWSQEEDISVHARRWLEKDQRQAAEAGKEPWATSYRSIGPLFLPRAAQCCAADGYVSLMQSTAVILNPIPTARNFRNRLLTDFAVKEIVNLSPLRYTLFSTASGATYPPCVITLRPHFPDTHHSVTYVCPKAARTVEDGYRLIVGPLDTHMVAPDEIIGPHNALIPLIWGGRRDLMLLKKLRELPTLAGMKAKGDLLTREGIIRGKTKQKDQPIILHRRILEEPDFPPGVFLTLRAEMLEENLDPKTDRSASTNFDAFELPQLIIKQSYLKSTGRFRAVRVKSNDGHGVICSQAYVTVHAVKAPETVLDAACLAYNSSFALYWLYLSNHRLASFIAEATVNDVLRLPLPQISSAMPSDAPDFAAVDATVRDALDLRETEWALVDDFFTYVLPEFKRLPDAPGPLATARGDAQGASLERYCRFFLKVLSAAFGHGSRFSATIFEDDATPLPVRLVAIHFDGLYERPIRTEGMQDARLLNALRGIENVVRGEAQEGVGRRFDRIVKVYDHFSHGSRQIPSLFIVKPDRSAYWTASVAMRDADEAFSEIMLWEPASRAMGVAPA